MIGIVASLEWRADSRDVFTIITQTEYNRNHEIRERHERKLLFATFAIFHSSKQFI